MGLFTKKEKVKLAPEAYPGQRAQLGGLAGAAQPGALERIGRAGEKYPGPLVAALSEFEETGLDQLRDFLGKPLPTEGELYTSAADEIMKTFSGEYDPAQGEYYKAYKTSVMRELEEAKDRLAARASAGDKYFGGGRIATEGEMEESALGDLAMVLGELFERERERKLGAVAPALGLTQYGEEAPVSRVAVSQQLGALPRLIEQAEMDAEYQEWIRALSDLGIALDTATGLATYSPTAIKTGGGLSDLGMLLLAGSGAAGSYFSAGGGGGGGGVTPQAGAMYARY